MVRCQCQIGRADCKCSTGLFLTGKIMRIREMMLHEGFLDLGEEVRRVAMKEYHDWTGRYYDHVAQEGLASYFVV